jgi:DSF synthase
MGFPEILFNLFPGMGALSLLGRKIGLKKAEEIILSGRLYSAQEMYDLGVVDLITEEGLGIETARAYIRNHLRHFNGYRALQQAKQHFQPVSLEEMKKVVGIWVDAALRLEPKDLKMMARLVKAQDRLLDSSEQRLDELCEQPIFEFQQAL